MDNKSEDVSSTVFKTVDGNDIGSFSIDSKMLSVLMALDGKKSLKVIGKKLNMDLEALRAVIEKLSEISLVEQVAASVSTLKEDFFDFLNIQLSFAIGPLSPIIIEDAIQDLGLGIQNFPIHRAAELVEMISREISREEKKIVFKQKMLSKIKTLQ